LTIDDESHEPANHEPARKHDRRQIAVFLSMSLDETLDVGEDTGTPVSEDYRVPFKFTGTIGRVAVRLGEEQLSAEEQKTFDEVRSLGGKAQ
jgi:hypothetical protein